MRKKINLQFMIVVMTAILATVSLVSIVYYELLKKEVMTNLEDYTHLIIETDAGAIVSDTTNADAEIFRQEQIKLRVTLIALDGTAIFDTNAAIGAMDNHNNRPEIVQARQDGIGKSIRKSSTIGRNTFYYACRLDNGYIIRVAKESGSLFSVYINVFPMIGVLCVALFIGCILLGHYLTKSIIDPIDRMAENMDNIDSVKVYGELMPFVQTIKKQHEDILKNANLRQEFTANVSHELKTPLTSISGYSELIESGMAGAEDTKRFAGEIHKSSDRLLTLINDIIRLSQLDQTMEPKDKFEEVNLYELAQNNIEILKFASKNNDVTIELHGSEQIVMANRQMMGELIYNLCDNAIRYNKPKGKVDITVSRNSENAVFVEVRDTGIGISEMDQERIFERFYRVDQSRSKSTGGTGLGLAIVKHIVSHHNNAHLELQSKVGKGTCIRIIFSENSLDFK